MTTDIPAGTAGVAAPHRAFVQRPDREQTGATAELPRWPFALIFLGYPLWWLAGLSDLIWIGVGGIMFLYLVRFRSVRVPKGFSVWVLFLLWMTCSSIAIDSPDRLLGFVYRLLIYLALTVIFVYVYNARAHLKVQYILGCLTVFWAVVVVGGYLGLLFPTVVIHTPLSYVLPQSLMRNELVNQMAIRRLTQFNPTAWNYIDPRPSAPFLYTNNWGAAYSLLLPLVVGYLWQIRRSRRFWLVLAAIPVSLIPAFLTLNRGMFLGLGIALLYAAMRMALAGNRKGLGALLGMGILVAIIVQVLPVTERLQNRLGVSSTTEDRESLYVEALNETLKSPIFGFGAPRPSVTIGAPSVGTQGQIWMVLYSHGFLAAAFFLLTFAVMFFYTLRLSDPVGLACNTVLLVSIVEVFYYGMLASGLALMLIAGSIGLQKAAALKRGLRPPGKGVFPSNF